MVVERVEFELVPGKEEAFLQTMQTNRGLLEGLEGCRSFRFGRGVENPSKAIFLVDWDSVEAHAEAKKTPAFAEFGKGLGGFVAGAAMEHFELTDPT